MTVSVFPRTPSEGLQSHFFTGNHPISGGSNTNSTLVSERRTIYNNQGKVTRGRERPLEF